MSSINIMDASAILAYLQQEAGEAVVEAALDQFPSWIGTVNYCEVLGKLCERGMPPGEALTTVNELGLITVDFSVEHAQQAAALRVQTKPIGASIGDRACLALAAHAARNKLTPIVYTAEHVWTKLKWPFKIVLIRPAKIIT